MRVLRVNFWNLHLPQDDILVLTVLRIDIFGLYTGLYLLMTAQGSTATVSDLNPITASGGQIFQVGWSHHSNKQRNQQTNKQTNKPINKRNFARSEIVANFQRRHYPKVYFSIIPTCDKSTRLGHYLFIFFMHRVSHAGHLGSYRSQPALYVGMYNWYIHTYVNWEVMWLFIWQNRWR